MSLIAKMEFHLEQEPLHVHLSELAHRLERDDPAQWLAVVDQFERSLLEYARQVAHYRARAEQRMGNGHGG